MAGLNGMGPEGLGAKTGRGLGNCNENNTLNEQDTITRGLGRGRMCKRGLGRRLRRG